MALALDPKLLEMMENCCVDKLQRMKLLPILVPSQHKFFKPDEEYMLEEDIIEYMKLAKVEIAHGFWPATTEEFEVRIVKTPGFDYICDDLNRDEKALYKLMTRIYNRGKCRIEDIGLILLINESLLYQNKDSIVPILHNLSMFITNEMAGSNQSNPLHEILVTQNIESIDKWYCEELEYTYVRILKTHGNIQWIAQYLRSMFIFVEKHENNDLEQNLPKKFQLPSQFNDMITFVTSTAKYREILECVNFWQYQDTLKILYFTYTLCLRIPEVSGQILYQLALRMFG